MSSSQESNPEPDAWTMVIRSRRGWFDIHPAELWRYRDLIYQFVLRDFVSVYKQTVLGPLWFLIQPLLTTVTFTIIFGRIAQLSTDGLPQFLFYMSGTVIWNYFAACLTKTSTTFVSNAHLFGKVYFPRLVVPVSVLISNLISFGIQFLLFIGFVIYYLAIGSAIRLNWWALLMPVLVLLMAGLGLGFGIIVSALTTRYRDLQYLVAFGVQLLMYATPVIYPSSSMTGIWGTLLQLNPMTPIVEAFRYGFLGAGTVEPVNLLYSAGFTLVVLAVGILLFNRVEDTFMDTV
jgi:lipopolysaccharide transport system permease protein